MLYLIKVQIGCNKILESYFCYFIVPTWILIKLHACMELDFHIILFVNSCHRCLESLMDDIIMWTKTNSPFINECQVKSKLKIWTTILNCVWKDYSSKLFFVLSIQLTLAIFGCLLLFQIAGSNFLSSLWHFINILYKHLKVV